MSLSVPLCVSVSVSMSLSVYACFSQVVMGRLEFNLGTVQYDIGNHSTIPLEAQVGLAAGAAVVVFIVLVIILMYR